MDAWCDSMVPVLASGMALDAGGEYVGHKCMDSEETEGDLPTTSAICLLPPR